MRCKNFQMYVIILNFINAYLVEGLTRYGYEFSSISRVTAPETNLRPYVKYDKTSDQEFHVFCNENGTKSIFQVWRSIQVILLEPPTKYSIFHGTNASEAHDNYNSQSSWLSYNIFSDSGTVIEFPSFSQYCIGIQAIDKYSLLLKVRTINYWRVLQSALGIFFFLASPQLSRNSFFHYATGVCFGVLASLLIALYFFSRFIPRKGASAVLGSAVFLFGSSFVVYYLNMLWQNIHEIATRYMDIVLSYCVVSALLSFVVCYRIGPVKDERTRNLIQWSMQGLSLVLIFFSSDYREMSTAVILLLISLKVIPIRWFNWIKYLWYRCFPPRVKLLTELEYIEQGHVETKKSLDNLRQYCTSPECKVWDVVRRLKDPVRFATFVDSGSHYTDEELLEYNTEDCEENSDEDDMTNLNENGDSE